MTSTNNNTQTASKSYPSLVGSDYLGRIYDVRNGRIARSSSLKTIQLFNFGSETNTITLGSLGTFSYPDNFQADAINETSRLSSSTEVYYSEDVENSFSVSLGLSGEVGSFAGEISGSYSQTTKNTYESSMAMATNAANYRVYKLSMKGSTSEWKALLTTQAKADINNTSGNMSADDLVAKYGTHFLASGYFGGVWAYFQSISTYTATSTTEVTETLEASAEKSGVAINGSAENKNTTTTTESESQTELFWEAIGGTTTSSYDAWESTVNQGNWNLINFDNQTNISLQLLSILAEDPARQADIEAAIEKVLPPYSTQSLYWKADGSRYTVNSGTVEKSFILDPATESHLVIVGLAFSVDNSNVKVLNAQLLNLNDGTTDWYTTDTNGDHVLVYNENAETKNSCDPGYVVTGMALNAGDSKMYLPELYGQAIDVRNINKNDYIGKSIVTFGDQDDAESTYKPNSGNNRIIRGLEVGVYHGDIGALYLHFGKFAEKTS